MIRNLKKRVFYILFLVLIQLGLKAQTTSSVYNFNSEEDTYPYGLVRNNNGDFYYISSNQGIKKITTDGVVSTILNSNDDITGIAIDSLDNIIYYSINSNSFQKVSADGTTSTFLSGFYLAFDLKYDMNGNLYFRAYDNNYNQSLNKVTPDGTLTSIVNGNVDSFTFDYFGNLYYLDQSSIQKVTPEGSISPYISTNYAAALSCDSLGNLYFLDYNSSSPSIKKVTPNGDVQVYLANDSNLVNPDGLISDSTGVLYFINNDYNTNTRKLIKVSLSCTQPGAPIVSAQSFEDGATVANLMVIGNNIKWYAASTGANVLESTTALTSRTYYVTQTVNDCESNRVPVLVTINKLGLGRYGQITADKSFQISKNGAINAGASINKYGKTTAKVAAGIGELNYETFLASVGHPNNSNEFSSYVNPANVASSGSASGSVLLNWESAATLTTAGISIPNGGEQFAVQVSGYFIPQESGIYTFTCEGDEAVDLFINDVNVANHYGQHGTESLGSHTGIIDLVAGTSYTFRARMQDAGGGEGLRVFWRKPSESSGWTINTNELSSTN